MLLILCGYLPHIDGFMLQLFPNYTNKHNYPCMYKYRDPSNVQGVDDKVMNLLILNGDPFNKKGLELNDKVIVMLFSHDVGEIQRYTNELRGTGAHFLNMRGDERGIPYDRLTQIDPVRFTFI